jgi:predicted anti-sigma-YlaC factor YlaD
MLTPVPPTDCMRAREAASLRLDGELSELDGLFLGLHLRECGPCRAYAREIAAITGELRSAALEQPGIRIFTPRRQRSRLPFQSVAVAAVGLVAAVGASFAIGRSIGTHGGAPAVTATRAVNVASVRADSAQQHVLAMVNRLRPAGRSSSARALPL